jgi:NADH-quinone oxidoreductase subunit J
MTQTQLIEAVAFYAFAGVTLLSALGVVFSKNIVRSATCLLGTLSGVAGLYFLMHANLLAAIQLIVYAGGTLILIVFGVMLTSKSPWVTFSPSRGQAIASSCVAILVGFGLSTLTMNTAWPVGTTLEASPQVRTVGMALLTDYLVPFEAASVLLLVVMIGAAYLARPEK